MGLLSDLPQPETPCKLGRILAGTLANEDGETLDDDDVARLQNELSHSGGTHITGRLKGAGFSISLKTVDVHLHGKCKCRQDMPLKACR